MTVHLISRSALASYEAVVVTPPIVLPLKGSLSCSFEIAPNEADRRVFVQRQSLGAQEIYPHPVKFFQSVYLVVDS
jgi:hypothetical protein